MVLLRFILPLFITLIALALVATPLAENMVARWFRRDVELRAQLIYQSVEDRLSEYAGEKEKAEKYRRLFDKIAQDDRVLAVGLCSGDGKLIAHSREWPLHFACPRHADTAPVVEMLQKGSQIIQYSSFPIPMNDDMPFSFIVLHDLTYLLNRAHHAGVFFLGFLLSILVTVATVTILTARFTLKNLLARLRFTLTHPLTSASQQGLPREFLPLVREVRQMLRDLKPSPYAFENIKIEWTPQTLKALLQQELPNSEVIVVSNREPYIHNLSPEGFVTLQRPASGVVTALEPIVRACGGTWIAHGSGSADKQMVDNHNCIAVPPDSPEYTLRRIWLNEEEEEGYYYGFANEGLWPLCHITFVRPSFRESDWRAYKAVNRKFADAVLEQAKTKNPLILVQDYHFALLPRYIRDHLPDATIITFWHIPWPNPEVFSICPWREEILQGLLGSSVLGFHTQFHCQNFMDTVDRFLESHINRDQSIISSGDHAALIRPYPISIAWPPEGLENVAHVPVCRRAVCERFGLSPDALIGVGVERFDYTKGIIDRFHAIGELLRTHPQWRGKFTFIQAAAPTRSRLPAYQSIQQETEALAEALNKEFGNDTYKPIILLARHHEPPEVFELFRAADFCVVSSLHDGMNLVAKEFVASRDDGKGALILSTFAGASKELLEALLVNPYDIKGMADAMHRALLMPPVEQAERMRMMREMVRDHNVYYWAARMLMDAAHLRKRARIENLITQTDTKEGKSNVIPLIPEARRTAS